LNIHAIREIETTQRQALQARRALPAQGMLELYDFSAPACEGSETGGVVFRRQLSRRLQAHVGHMFDLINIHLLIY
jgi:hypothetical protein